MGENTFGWSELISLAAVVISFATVLMSLKARSSANSKNDQQVLDKLDSLESTTKETNQDVKTITRQLDHQQERLATLEAEMKNAFFRIKRVEDTQDNCQACRASKQSLSGA